MTVNQWGEWIWPFVGLMTYVSLARGLWTRKAAGRVLLDLGLEISVVSLVASALLVVGGFARTVFFHWTLWSVATIAIGLGIGAEQMIRRNQVREAGLFGRGYALFRWEKISGYELSPTGTLRLKLHGKDFPIFDVPPEHVVALEKLLTSKMPGSTPGSR